MDRWRLRCVVASVRLGVVLGGAGETDITQSLNHQISRGSSGVYTGGKGVIVRNPYDDYENREMYTVVPATFWSNDIFAPSQLFPSTSGTDDNWGATKYNPDCPNDGDNGYFKTIGCKQDPGTGEWGPWNYASVAYVIGTGMYTLMYDYDNIQSTDWGWGVFYPSDSNSVDWRCRYIPDYDGYDCGPDPDKTRSGGWIDGSDGTWYDNPDKQGTGAYPSGNPDANPSWGGGTGCHLDKTGQTPISIDQTDAYDSSGKNIVQDKHCQCNYEFNQDWNAWVQHWIDHATPKATTAFENWFQGGLAPSRALDMVSCWVNNPRDMINLQNALYWARERWSNQLTPKTHWTKDPASTRIYWGWNELPMDRLGIIDPQNRDATVVKLPASVCGNGGSDDSLACLSPGAAYALERDLDNWAKDGYLKPGVANVASRPGSYIVVAKEYVDDWYNWQKVFFCEDWTSPNGNWKIVYQPMTTQPYNPTGACFLEYGWAQVAGNLTLHV